jgi:hypothetical protein
MTTIWACHANLKQHNRRGLSRKRSHSPTPAVPIAKLAGEIENVALLPGSEPEPAVQISANSLLSGGWLRPLMLVVRLAPDVPNATGNYSGAGLGFRRTTTRL